MTEKKEVLYHRTDGEVQGFFLNEALLFTNSSRRPFITVYEKAGAIEKITPLFNSRINKVSETFHQIAFNNKTAEVICDLKIENGILSVKIKGKGQYFKFKFYLNKNGRIVRGFGCNAVNNWTGKALKSGDLTPNDKANGVIEKDLSFELIGAYRFINETADAWEAAVNKSIEITVYGSEISFHLDPNVVPEDEPNLAEKTPKYYFKTKNLSVNYLSLASDKYRKLDGVIPDLHFFDPKQLMLKEIAFSRVGLKLLYNADLEFPTDAYFYKHFKNISEIVTKIKLSRFKTAEVTTYTIDTNDDIKRETANCVRHILDIDFDGIILNSTPNVKSKLIEEFLYAADAVKGEYEHIKVAVIYDRLNRYKENACYLIKNSSGVNRVNLIRSLKASGVSSIALEYAKNSTDGAEKYADYIIINDEN